MILPRKQIVVVSWKVFLHIGDFIFYFFISSIPTFSSSFHLRLITASLLHIIKQSEHRRTVEKREDIWFIKKKKISRRQPNQGHKIKRDNVAKLIFPQRP